MVAQAPWSRRECVAWRAPKLEKPSQWAEAHRILPRIVAEPGPWHNARTPYLAEIMDSVAEATVEEIVFLKPTQVGFTEAIRNILGYWIDVDPGPTLLVMPDEKSAREAMSERIIPMLEDSPALERHTTGRPWDAKNTSIKLDSMQIYVGWAGSAQSLASRPCRYVAFDEIDKYPAFSGKEGDPISLGTERTNTFTFRRKILKGSTPTTRDGNIWKAWEACSDRRHYFVPCPHCGTYQALTWAQCRWQKTIVLPDGKIVIAESQRLLAADLIEMEGLAWYECVACKERIPERHKAAMLARGQWVSEGQTIDKAGALSGQRPKSKRIGFHLNALYSPWVRWSAMAAEFLRAQGDQGKLMNFWNSKLAEPFEQLVTRVDSSAVKHKAKSGPAPEIPADTVGLVATIDVQQDHFYFLIRAWCASRRSRLIACGVLRTWDELYRVCLQSGYGTRCMVPMSVLIDSGYGERLSETYDFVWRDPLRILPTKGASHNLRSAIQRSPQPNGIVLWNIDTSYYKDRLVELIADADATKWEVFKGASDDYCLQLASEHKIWDRAKNKAIWTPRTSHAPNHYLDCEVLQLAAVDLLRLDVAPMPHAHTSPKDTPSGWLAGVGE